MRIGDVCTRTVIQATAAMPLLEAARAMHTQQVGALVVVTPGAAGPVPVGVLTDRDVVMALVDARRDARALAVGDVMAHAPATCGEDDALFDVITLMRRRGIRRVPVVDAAGALAGIVTSDDVVGALAEHIGELARALVSDELLEVRRHGG